MTKVSKNRQVRRAVRRRACASASDGSQALDAARQADQRATAGESEPKRDEGRRQRPGSLPDSSAPQGRRRDEDGARHSRVEPRQIQTLAR